MKVIIAFILGGFAGITTMCLVQINRHTENELRKAEIDNEKEYNQTVSF